MDRVRLAIISSLAVTTISSWIVSIGQPDMMVAMTTYDPVLISLFAASWTAGMAAMMFPAITPMVLLYSKFLSYRGDGGQSSLTIQAQGIGEPYFHSLRVALFIGCYLLIWALTGVSLLLAWSVVMNNTIMSMHNSQMTQSIYGSLLVGAGVYQFSSLKRKCIGYCESPMSFFAKRWRDGTTGAVKMGLWHGLYCLGCCWPYFLLMVALGWMNLLWMGLFAGIIFGEKVWLRGVWIARAAGIVLAIIGFLTIAGLAPSLLPSSGSMNAHGKDGGGFGIGMAGDIVGQHNTNSTQMAMPPQTGSSDAGKTVKTGHQSFLPPNMTMP